MKLIDTKIIGLIYFLMACTSMLAIHASENITLTSQDQAIAGSQVSIEWIGPANSKDYITIVKPDADATSYANYQYVSRANPVSVKAPVEPGEYEIRYNDETKGTVLARKLIKIVAAEINLSAAESAIAGSEVAITWQGPNNDGDYITIVKQGASGGSYTSYVYTKYGNAIKLKTPVEAGNYEIRYASEGIDKIFASIPITLTTFNTTLDAPGQAEANSTIEIHWQGANNPGDYITIVAKGASGGSYTNYVYTKYGNPVKLKMPAEAGEYEIRYATDGSNKTFASKAISIQAFHAKIIAADTANVAATIPVIWEGPNNPRDYITIVKQGASAGSYTNYVYTKYGNPVKLKMLPEPGDYEIRYAADGSNKIFASKKIKLLEVTASLQATTKAKTAQLIDINWQGPDNDGDYITIVKKDATEGSWDIYSYTKRGNPLQLTTPDKPGDYEIRYALNQSNRTLARQDLTVVQGEQKGSLLVKASAKTLQKNQQAQTVALILDASGSMLKKQDGTRRIEIAKNALQHLVNNVLNEQTDFSLRVFGHLQEGSCQSDLEIPLQKLNKKSVNAKINNIQAKNLAKTPIAKSLELILQDVKSATSPITVILLTDGEETCEGVPEQAIKKLIASGLNVKVNIIGFAIDEYALKKTFTHWAKLGHGHYFNAQNNDELKQSISSASNTSFKVTDLQGKEIASGVVNGQAVSLPTGKYLLQSSLLPEQIPIEIIAQQMSNIEL